MDPIVVRSWTLHALAANAEPDDRDVFVRLFGEGADAAFDAAQAEAAPPAADGLSKPQRILLGLYVHLLAALQGRDLGSDRRLQQTRQGLRLSEGFARFALQALTRLDRAELEEGRGALYVVADPTPFVEAWATRMTHTAHTGGLYDAKRTLTGLDPRAYEHPTDRRALDALQRTAGLDTAIRKFNEYGLDRLMRVEHTGSNLRVTAETLPREHRALQAVCETLTLQPTPDLYLMPGAINAYTVGVRRPLVALASDCCSLLTYDELLFVMGHEIGHVKSEHVLYHQLARALAMFGGMFDKVTLGLGGLVTAGLQVALLAWQRRAEFTADRAGLLACQNVDAAVSAMMKLAGLPPSYYSIARPAQFLQQADEFDALDEDGLSRVAKFAGGLGADHPWTVVRAREMHAWVRSGEYEQLLDAFRPTAKAAPAPAPAFCTDCGGAFGAEERFCTACGARRG